MGDVLVLDGTRDARPWYRDPALVGSNLYDTPTGGPPDDSDIEVVVGEDGKSALAAYLPDGYTGQALVTEFAVARFLPEDTYLPTDFVLALLTSALWWGKAIDVSWMQMQDEDGLSVPIQHHRKAAALVYLDDDHAHFGVAGPDDDRGQRIATDCVTDLRLVIPDPKPLQTKHLQIDGNVVLWSHVSDESMKADGFVRSSKSHWLDDGTEVPIFVDERGYEFSPILVRASSPDLPLEARERIADDLLWRGVQVDG